ncbi:hypothetical protein [Rathayibacter sp. AY1C5]|uniref:hypothetical protein n=1 Tax=Rathayibacter sp. AY1C5 TaxID=2080538 RepID=UPI0011B0039F|nr:hypothetical protein [Rathayibacter sp. AY1C5]
MRRILVALTPLVIALAGVATGLAVAPDVRAGWIVLGVTAAVVGLSAVVAALYLFMHRQDR